MLLQVIEAAVSSKCPTNPPFAPSLPFTALFLYSLPQSPEVHGIFNKTPCGGSLWNKYRHLARYSWLLLHYTCLCVLHPCTPETVNLNSHIGVLPRATSSIKGLYNNNLIHHTHTHTHTPITSLLPWSTDRNEKGGNGLFRYLHYSFSALRRKSLRR